ncbi:PQQ-binding-like beta-propeller repeat protein [Streptomyces sp. NPDC058240]|uniref:outer membrane protein assembly factor BamB family protein n=1 Tax=Streptomyces sp. NPDC058240 TaxID=3346396 RepID=UPI0036E0DBDD
MHVVVAGRHGRVALAASRQLTARGGQVSGVSLSAGAVLWRHALDGRGTGPVYADGVVYVGTHAGTVLAVDAETGRKPPRARRKMRIREAVG